jgi:adenylate kinase
LILDGYPRNPSHLTILDSILTDLDRKIFAAVLFDVPKTTLLSRVSGRRICGQCGAIHNLNSIVSSSKDDRDGKDVPCGRCGTALVKRKDDSEEVLYYKTKLINFNYSIVFNYMFILFCWGFFKLFIF